MSRLSKMLSLIGISLFSFTGYLDATIVSTALPAIQHSLQMTVSQLQWIMNAFFIGISAFMISMGRVADIYGRRLVLYIGVVVFGLASIGAGLATNMTLLIICRVLQGVTTAITIPVGIGLLNVIFDSHEIGKAMGIFSGITGAGLALGPIVGGLLVAHFGWPSVFFINIPFIVLGFLLCSLYVKESRSDDRSMTLDKGGMVFLALTIASFVFALIEGAAYGWTSVFIMGVFIIATLSLIAFIIIESKVAHPIMSGELFRHKIFIASTLFMFVGGGAMGIILFIDPLYLTTILQQSHIATGLFLFIISILVVMTSLIVGQQLNRFGTKAFLLLGAGLYLVAALLHLLFPIYLSYPLITVAFIIFGCAWGICNTVPAVALSQGLTVQQFSVGIGALFSFYNIGATVLLAIGMALYHSRSMQYLVNTATVNHIANNTEQMAKLQNYLLHPNELSALVQYIEHIKTQVAPTLPPEMGTRLVADVMQANQSVVDLIKSAFTVGLHSMFWPIGILLILAGLLLIFVMPKQQANKTDKVIRHGL